MTLCVLIASDGVKNHWLARFCWLFCGVDSLRGGDAALLREAGLGGDILDDCVVGGDGTAGGICL
jgi:hypothetical protein